MNKVILKGYVEEDPKITLFSWGKLASFNVVTLRVPNFVKKNSHSVNCQCELANYVEKNVKAGNNVTIRGHIEYLYIDEYNQSAEIMATYIKIIE